MEKELFSPMAIDAIGEMMNISLGSSATAVSNMLDHRVDITTPTVTVVKVADFSLGSIEPAMGVEIKYVEGLDGSNIMLLKKSDIKIIADILMGTETPDEEFELNELTVSCVCEVMNQMMGAAATALSDFLGYPVNISTPEPFELDDLDAFRSEHLPNDTDVVVVRFALRIEGALESEFMNVMSVSLARNLLSGLGLEEEGGEAPAPAPEPAPAPAPEPAPAPAPEPEPSGGGDRKLTQEEIERMMSGGTPEPAPAPAPAPEPSGGGDRKLTQEEIERMMSGGTPEPAPAPAPAPTPAPAPAAPVQPAANGQQVPPQGAVPGQMPMYPPMPGAEGAPPYANGYMYPPYYPPYPYPYPPQEPQPEPKKISTTPLPMEPMTAAEKLGKEQAENLELIMEVPLQVTVEIGRARRKVQDILEFTKGSLVVLDKLAGDQVDLFVNGKCVARGDVVVVEDNFGVRITEIVQNSGLEIFSPK